ncbi:MAG TPA: hypothetical protein VN114_05790 [Oxalicibacterium sp.]|nr:hypothetical protein [Oxalicibacterium sp.]HWU98005.1 hypothetical protein [Oxalicibacterium sp.]
MPLSNMGHYLSRARRRGAILLREEEGGAPTSVVAALVECELPI